jgi:hypothetical protein
MPAEVIPNEWLQEKITAEQAEALISHHKSAAPRARPEWRQLHSSLQEGDEIWRYFTENPKFRRDRIVGIAVLRDGQIIGYVMVDVNP